MKVGDLVKHIEYEYIGILVKHDISSYDTWTIRWSFDFIPSYGYSECELEVISESR